MLQEGIDFYFFFKKLIGKKNVNVIWLQLKRHATSTNKKKLFIWKEKESHRTFFL